MKPFARNRAMIEIGGERDEPGRDAVPIIERGLERRRDGAGIGEPGQIVGHDDELTITA